MERLWCAVEVAVCGVCGGGGGLRWSGGIVRWGWLCVVEAVEEVEEDGRFSSAAGALALLCNVCELYSDLFKAAFRPALTDLPHLSSTRKWHTRTHGFHGRLRNTPHAVIGAR